MARIEQSPIYLISKTKAGYSLNTIYRALGWRVSSQNAVRFNRYWYPLYDARKLKKFLKTKQKKRQAMLVAEGKIISFSNFVELPFIKEWDKPIGRYRSFSMGGFQ